MNELKKPKKPTKQENTTKNQQTKKPYNKTLLLDILTQNVLSALYLQFQYCLSCLSQEQADRYFILPAEQVSCKSHFKHSLYPGFLFSLKTLQTTRTSCTAAMQMNIIWTSSL